MITQTIQEGRPQAGRPTQPPPALAEPSPAVRARGYSHRDRARSAAEDVAHWMLREEAATAAECGDILLAAAEACTAIRNSPEFFLASLREELLRHRGEFARQTKRCAGCGDELSVVTRRCLQCDDAPTRDDVREEALIGGRL